MVIRDKHGAPQQKSPWLGSVLHPVWSDCVLPVEVSVCDHHALEQNAAGVSRCLASAMKMFLAEGLGASGKGGGGGAVNRR